MRLFLLLKQNLPAAWPEVATLSDYRLAERNCAEVRQHHELMRSRIMEPEEETGEHSN